MESTTETQEPRKMLTVTEVAAELRISRGTAYRLVANGTLPSVRFGGNVRVPARLLMSTLARSARP